MKSSDESARSLGTVNPDVIRNYRFSTAFRGYDTAEVRAFLNSVADAVATYSENASAFVLSVAESVNPAAVSGGTVVAPPAQPSAEDLAALEAARANAESIVAAAKDEANSIVSRANDEAARIVLRARAESRGKPSADTMAAMELALADAPSDPNVAREQARIMISEAKAVRERILTDLAKRRRVAHVQLEQLRVAREKLLESFRDARRVADEASRDLSTAEVEARLAAETAGRRVGGEDLPTVAELEAELFSGRSLLPPIPTAAAPSAPASTDASSTPAAHDRATGSADATHLPFDIEAESEPVQLEPFAQAVVDQAAVDQARIDQAEVEQARIDQAAVDQEVVASVTVETSGHDQSPLDEVVSGEVVSDGVVAAQPIDTDVTVSESVVPESAPADEAGSESVVSDEVLSDEVLSVEAESDEDVPAEDFVVELASHDSIDGQSLAGHESAELTVDEHTVDEHTVDEHSVAEHTVAEHSVAEHTVAEHTVAEHTVDEQTVESVVAGLVTGDSVGEEILSADEFEPVSIVDHVSEPELDQVVLTDQSDAVGEPESDVADADYEVVGYAQTNVVQLADYAHAATRSSEEVPDLGSEESVPAPLNDVALEPVTDEIDPVVEPLEETTDLTAEDPVDEPEAHASAPSSEPGSLVEATDSSDTTDSSDSSETSDPADTSDASRPPALSPVARLANVDDLFARLRRERENAAASAHELLDGKMSKNGQSKPGGPTPGKGKKNPPKLSGNVMDRMADEVDSSQDDSLPSADLPAPSYAEEARSETESGDATLLFVDLTAFESEVLNDSRFDPSSPEALSDDLFPPTTPAVSGRVANPATSTEFEFVTGTLQAQCTRAMKRFLQDEQSRALAALRTARGRVTLEDLLGDAELREQRLGQTVQAYLNDAYRAGADLSVHAVHDESVAAELKNLEIGLASMVTGTTRGAIDRALNADLSAVGQTLSDAIADVYRGWPSERLSSMVSEHLRAAFQLGHGLVH